MIKFKIYKRSYHIVKFFPLFKKIYPDLSKKDLKKLIKEMVGKHKYRLIVAFNDKTPIGISGFTIHTMLYTGKVIQPANIYVEEIYRKQGVAGQLIEEMRKIGKKNKCKKVVLDSYVTNLTAHNLYLKENLEVKAYHFMQDL